jgi:F-type H+-transporting ATPase subunit epsilon
MSEKTFHVEIVTPEALKYEGEITLLEVPGVEGQMGILANHAPLLSLLEPGVLHYRSRGLDYRMAVGEGFVKVAQNRAVCLVDVAERPDEVDAQAAGREASELASLLSRPASAEEREVLRRRLELARARLRVARESG